jgi:hypothetical protein
VIARLRRFVQLALVVIGILVAALALPATDAFAEGADHCTVRPNVGWTYLYDTRTGHAISGTMSIAPSLVCNAGKLGMSVRGVLRRDHSQQLTTSKSCRFESNGLSSCTKVQSPKVHKSYGTSIRGTWDEVVFATLTGPGVQAYVRGDPGHCSYRASTLTATCTYTFVGPTIR